MTAITNKNEPEFEFCCNKEGDLHVEKIVPVNIEAVGVNCHFFGLVFPPPNYDNDLNMQHKQTDSH